MAKKSIAKTPEVDLSILLSEAKLRLELPALVLRALDLNPALAREALLDWSGNRRPLAEVVADLRRALGSAPNC